MSKRRRRWSLDAREYDSLDEALRAYEGHPLTDRGYVPMLYVERLPGDPEHTPYTTPDASGGWWEPVDIEIAEVAISEVPRWLLSEKRTA